MWLRTTMGNRSIFGALRETGRQSRLLLLEYPPSHKQKPQLVLVLS